MQAGSVSLWFPSFSLGNHQDLVLEVPPSDQIHSQSTITLGSHYLHSTNLCFPQEKVMFKPGQVPPPRKWVESEVGSVVPTPTTPLLRITWEHLGHAQPIAQGRNKVFNHFQAVGCHSQLLSSELSTRPGTEEAPIVSARPCGQSKFQHVLRSRRVSGEASSRQ